MQPQLRLAPRPQLVVQPNTPKVNDQANESADQRTAAAASSTLANFREWATAKFKKSSAAKFLQDCSEQASTISKSTKATFASAAQTTKTKAANFAIGLADSTAKLAVAPKSDKLKEQEAFLQKLTDNKLILNTLESITQKITLGLKYLHPEVATLTPNLESTVYGVLVVVCVNIVQQIPIQERTKNPILDIFSFVINIIRQHVEGDVKLGIPHMYDELLRCEAIADENDRNKQMGILFAPLSESLLKIAIPDGLKSLGYGSFSSANIMLTLSKMLGGFSLLKFVAKKKFDVRHIVDDPGFIGKMLYGMVIEPVSKTVQNEQRLKATEGGKALLHIVAIAQEQLGPILFNLLADKSEELSPQIIAPIPGKDQQPLPKTPFQKNCENWFAKKFAETVNSPNPNIQKARHFGGFVVKSVALKILINLAEGHAKTTIDQIDNPLHHVGAHLKELLKKHYPASIAAKKLVNDNRQLYQNFRTHSLRLWELKALPRSNDVLQENAKQEEIKRLTGHINAFLALPDRKKLVDEFFTPVTKDILQATGMDHPDGLRLTFGPLNQVIQESIPDGLCCLFELLMIHHPGFIEWIHPEMVVKEKSERLDKLTGSPVFSAIAKTAAPYILDLLPYLLQKHSAFLTDEMLTSINFILPDSLKMNAAKAMYQTEINGVFQNIASRNVADDDLWKCASQHLTETILDVFLAHSEPQQQVDIEGQPPKGIVPLATQLLFAISQFQFQHGATLSNTYKDLPIEATPEQKAEVFTKHQQLFIDFTGRILRILGVDFLVKGTGKFGVFTLDAKLEKELPKAAFLIHLKLSRLDIVQRNIHDQMCAAIYDKEKFIAALRANPAQKDYSQYISQAADPTGKSFEDRANLWVASGTDEVAKHVGTGCLFLSDLTCFMLRHLATGKSADIVDFLTKEDGILAAYDFKKEDLVILEKTIQILGSIQTPSLRSLWSYVPQLFNLALSQIVVNVIAPVPQFMPPNSRHSKWTSIGDVAVKIFNIFGENMAITNKEGNTVAAHANALKLKITEIRSSGTALAKKKELKDLSLQLSGLFNKMAQDVMNMMARRANLQDNHHPMQGLPIPDDLKKFLWEKIIPNKLSGLFANFFETVTPSKDGLRTNLHKVFGSNHVAEYCRILAMFIRDVTPFKLREQKDRMSKDMLDAMEATLASRFSHGPGQDFLKVVKDNRESIELMLAHTFELLGNNSDAAGAMQRYIWPFLEMYAESFLLIAANKVFGRIKSIEQHQPNYLFSVIVESLRVCRDYMRKINRVKNEAGVNFHYELSQEQMFQGMGNDLHPALKAGLGASPEDAHKARMELYYTKLFQKLLSFANFSAKDFPVPIYLQDPLFQLLRDVVGPISLEQMTHLCYQEDGKEIMFDKTAEVLFQNINTSLQALEPYARESEAEAVEPQSPHQNQLDAALFDYLGDIFHGLVQMIPEYYTKQLLSLTTFKQMTAAQCGRMLKRFIRNYGLVQIISLGAKNGLAKFCDGDWRNIDTFMPKHREFHVDLSDKEKEEEALKNVQRAQEVKSQISSTVDKGIFAMLKGSISALWQIIENGLMSLCEKIFGKNKEHIYGAIIQGLRHIGIFFSWVFTPVYLLVKGLIFLYTKSQTGLVIKNMKHPAHIELGFQMMEALLALFIKTSEHLLERKEPQRLQGN